MTTQVLLGRLAAQVSQLTSSIAALPQEESVSRRFNCQLFHSYGNRLSDYQGEIITNLYHLEQMVEQQHLQQVAFLAEKLVAQITALQREVATLPLRRQESQSEQLKHETLHQRLVQYRDYQQRLQQMIEAREHVLQQATQPQSQRAQTTREIVALQGRLARCCAALRQLEKQIERQESDYYEPSD